MSLFANKNNNIVYILKSPVATFSAITTTYPNPDINWITQTTDTGKRYKWSGSSWDYIDYQPLNTIVVDGNQPSFTSNILWIDING